MNRSFGQLLVLSMAVLLIGAMTAGTALARGGSGHGRSGKGSGGSHAGHHGQSGKSQAGRHGAHRHGRAVTGVGATWAWWGYAPYGVPPGAVVMAPPIHYVERVELEQPAPVSWLYCPATGGYFPYVGECGEGWIEVPATPPGVTISGSVAAGGGDSRDAPAGEKIEVSR